MYQVLLLREKKVDGRNALLGFLEAEKGLSKAEEELRLHRRQTEQPEGHEGEHLAMGASRA